MALSKEIVKRINDKTKSDEKMNNFLLDILNFESQDKGWYEKDYVKILEENSKEEI